MRTIGFKKSRQSLRYYFEWRKHRSQSAVRKIEKYQNLNGLNILDVGCGYGPMIFSLLEKNSKVTGVEIDENKIKNALFFLSDRSGYQIIKVKDEILPFPDNNFDLVILFDVVEHVRKPDITISECKRVLKPHGVLYVEFTPYYSITGHHLYDYARWPIHILPKQIIKYIVYKKKIHSFMTADYYWHQFITLNKIKISTFQKFIKDFKKVDERFIVKYPELFEMNIPLLNIFGPFKDFFTMSFEGIYINIK